MEQFAQILIPPLPQELTYSIPEDLQSQIEIGAKVLVPLGSRVVGGYVVSKGTKSSEFGFKLKPLKGVTRECFEENQLKFYKWIADYYCDHLSNVIDAAVPQIPPRKFSYQISLVSTDTSGLRGKKHTQVIGKLEAAGGTLPIEALKTIATLQTLKSLEKRGCVLLTKVECLDQHISGQTEEWARKDIKLNLAQTSALNAVLATCQKNSFECFLLHGVTGSGKTEVYIEAINALKEQGRSSLLIVPEIALTFQVIERFKARLGKELAILHSGLSARSRWDAWRALLEGRNLVAIGTRSSIFAPLKNLGLIIIDEEHDGSFKQSEGLRYNARDLAIVRAKQQACPIILGSATPSLESYHRAIEKKYTYLSLPSKAWQQGMVKAAPALDLKLVDLTKIKPWDMPSKNISPDLHAGLMEVLDRNEQAFILYNRRGFATYLQCEVCETVVTCPNCSVTLTYHRTERALVCHYCNLHIARQETCVSCAQQGKKSEMRERGAGTERIYDEISELFPQARIDRLDRDRASRADEYRSVLDKVRSGETQILIGTQMLAKGHDLPNVTLIGIADSDVGLHLPDFRAAERVFQLLTQAAGRAGRAEKPGKVILQTRMPNHPSLRETLTQNYKNFAKNELDLRKGLFYPPYCRLLRIVASSKMQSLPENVLSALKVECIKHGREWKNLILGPAPAPLEKIKQEWRWHMLIKSKSAAQLNVITRHLKNLTRPRKNLKVIFDLDPLEML